MPGASVTAEELLRIIHFLRDVQAPLEHQKRFSDGDPAWNMTLYIMEQYLHGAAITTTALARASGLPHATAMRRIAQMTKSGHLLRVPKGGGLKGHNLLPSEGAVEDFTTFGAGMKRLLARTVGQRREKNPAEFYLGGGRIGTEIDPPNTLGEKLKVSHARLSFMVNDDNYFASMRNLWADYRAHLGSLSDFRMVSLHELHDTVRAELQRSAGHFDVVTFDCPWLGEFAGAGLLRPLDDLIAGSSFDASRYNPAIWATGNWNGKQYGIPIYTTIEILAARSDLFAEAGLPYPRTFDKTVEAAAKLHRPSRGVHGIGWHASRGLPIASTFMILLGCCGASLLHYPTQRRVNHWSELKGAQLRPNLLSREAETVLDYLHRLIPYSPPDILDMDWNRATAGFLSGHLGMAYCWSMRAARFEYDVGSRVQRKVAYLPQPKGPGGVSANPVGGFHLAIPRNIGAEKARLAFEAISWFARPGFQSKSGFPIAPHFSTAADPEVAQSAQVFSFADSLARKGLASTWQRPAIPEWRHIERIIGEAVHAALRGEIGDKQALTNAQNAIDKLMRANGRY